MERCRAANTTLMNVTAEGLLLHAGCFIAARTWQDAVLLLLLLYILAKMSTRPSIPKFKGMPTRRARALLPCPPHHTLSPAPQGEPQSQGMRRRINAMRANSKLFPPPFPNGLLRSCCVVTRIAKPVRAQS